MARIGSTVAQMFELTADDVCYEAMPLFHSNALMAGWAPALSRRAQRWPLRQRFSASQFLTDVRRFGATYFNYVGKPLVVHPGHAGTVRRRRQPAAPGVRQRSRRSRRGPVRRAIRLPGTGRLRVDRRWRAPVTRTPDTPRGALGRAAPGTMIINPRRARSAPGPFSTPKAVCSMPRRPSARWSARPVGPGSRATGGTTRPRRPGCATAGTGPATSATGTRTTSSTSPAGTTTGSGWTARTSPPPRSKSILQRHPDVVLASVYAVPDVAVGDQVMATLLLHDGRRVRSRRDSPVPLRARPDMGTKCAPSSSDRRPTCRSPPPPRCSSGSAGRRVARSGPRVVATREAGPGSGCRARRRRWTRSGGGRPVN